MTKPEIRMKPECQMTRGQDRCFVIRTFVIDSSSGNPRAGGFRVAALKTRFDRVIAQTTVIVCAPTMSVGAPTMTVGRLLAAISGVEKANSRLNARVD